MKFSFKDFFSKCDQIHSFLGLTEEILDGKLHILCSKTCFDIPSYIRSTLADVHVNLHESLLFMKIYS